MLQQGSFNQDRSEERRVGKECRVGGCGGGLSKSSPQFKTRR